LASGYAVLVIGYGTQFTYIAVQDGFTQFPAIEFQVYYLSFPLAYAITGWSWFCLSNVLSGLDENRHNLRRAFRGLSIQSVVLSIGTLAMTDVLRNVPDATALKVGWHLGAVGGVFVAIGFWLLASRSRAVALENASI
jgi:hypothetical protein